MALDLVRGWYADRNTDDDEGVQPGMWSPYLQGDGVCLPLPISFDTKEACEAFIRREVVGAGWVDGPRAYACPDCAAEAGAHCLNLATGERRLTFHAERLRFMHGGWPS